MKKKKKIYIQSDVNVFNGYFYMKKEKTIHNRMFISLNGYFYIKKLINNRMFMFFMYIFYIKKKVKTIHNRISIFLRIFVYNFILSFREFLNAVWMCVYRRWIFIGFFFLERSGFKIYFLLT